MKLRIVTFWTLSNIGDRYCSGCCLRAKENRQLCGSFRWKIEHCPGHWMLHDKDGGGIAWTWGESANGDRNFIEKKFADWTGLKGNSDSLGGRRDKMLEIAKFLRQNWTKKFLSRRAEIFFKKLSVKEDIGVEKLRSKILAWKLKKFYEFEWFVFFFFIEQSL